MMAVLWLACGWIVLVCLLGLVALWLLNRAQQHLDRQDQAVRDEMQRRGSTYNRTRLHPGVVSDEFEYPDGEDHMSAWPTYQEGDYLFIDQGRATLRRPGKQGDPR